jgi:hypothetical protein
MFIKLPQEILLQLTRYLTIKETVVLSTVNRNLNHRLVKDSKFVVQNELEVYFKAQQHTSRHRLFSMMIGNMMFACTYGPTQHYTIEDNHVLAHLDQHGTLQNFKNMFILFGSFISMESRSFSTVNIPYIVNFWGVALNRNRNKIALNYNIFALQSGCVIDFDTLNVISYKVVSPCSLKKLFGYKPLLLGNAKFVRCCHGYYCLRELATYVVLLRYNLQKDSLIEHNYNEIKKSCLINSWYEFYDMISNYELDLVDTHIKIKDPFTNHRVHINSPEHFNLINELYQLKRYKHIRNIKRAIHYRRRRIRRALFG